VACLIAAALAGTTGRAGGTTAVLNDPYWASQSRYLDAIGLDGAWAVTSGSPDVTVAVVDSGVDLDHPDLAGRLLPGFDAVDGDNHPQDEHGHGTLVAGIIAATADNGIGVAGVLRAGSILPVRVMNRFGKVTDEDVAEGLRWAADHGADVISLSIGNTTRSATVDAAIADALARNVVVVAAAGNFHSDQPNYPAATDGVVAVAATDAQGRFAAFSSYGDWIDLAAPGVGIFTTGLADGPAAEIRVAEGTSMAAPLVAAVAALLRAADPSATAAQIAARLRNSASDRGPHGADPYYGAGMLDAAAALRGEPGTPHLDWVADAAGPDSTPSQARLLPAGAGLAGTIAPEGDTDWYAVDVPERSTLSFTVVPPPTLEGQGPAMDPALTVYDPDLRLLQPARTWAGKTETATVAAARPGRYRVQVGNDLVSQSPGPYTVTVSATPRQPAFFYVNDNGDAARPVPSGVAVGLADVDSDERAEMLIGAGGTRLEVHNPDSDGLPTAEVSSLELGPAGGARFATGDVDGDGDTDVVVAANTRILLAKQDPGGLRDPAEIGPAAEQVALGDLDGDGRTDIVYEDGTKVGWLRNTGTGWSSPRPVSPGRLESLRVGDVTGDGRTDIVGLGCVSACPGVVVLRADGGEAYSPVNHPINPMPGTHVEAVALGDVSGDGRTDVVVTGNRVTEAGGGVYLLAQQPDGTLGASGLAAARTRPTGPLVVADIDDNGRNDIIVGGQGGAGVLTGRGDGTLNPEIYTAVASTGVPDATSGLAVGDANGDGATDILLGVGELIRQQHVTAGARPWLDGATPAAHQFDVDPAVAVRFALTRPLDPDSLDDADATLRNARTGATVNTTLSWDQAARTLIVTPHQTLTADPWVVTVGGHLRDADGDQLPEPLRLRFTVGPRPPLRATPEPPPNPPGHPDDPAVSGAATRRSGYWMLDGAGAVYHFGDAAAHGDAMTGAVDLEPTPTGKGYWVLQRNGVVADFGDAGHLGNVDLSQLGRDEVPASLSATPTGRGYWVFTNRGRVIAFGDAPHLGDMAQTKLNGPVLGSVATPTGKGYYMVASDGGIFAFGDAAFAGSMGGKPLNKPVQSLVPDADGNGYWLVASDGGIFAFDAPFRGSMGASKLNKPVVGMVRYGDGYLMVGADGGIFNFSTSPFAGSLGDKPPASAVVAVAALPS
jgi:hypothetical protein